MKRTIGIYRYDEQQYIQDHIKNNSDYLGDAAITEIVNGLGEFFDYSFKFMMNEYGQLSVEITDNITDEKIPASDLNPFALTYLSNKIKELSEKKEKISA